jgi:hypothetical protein
MNATDAQLEREPSCYLNGSRWKAEKEECYFRFSAVWRGERVQVDMTANRSPGHDNEHWSSWHPWVSRTNPAVSDTARSRLGDVCRPLALEWLASDAYKPARQRAFEALIARELRDERYNADTPRQLLDKYAHELTEEDALRLREAVGVLVRFLELTRTP